MPKEGWQVGNGKATAQWKLDADYAQNFDLLYLQGLQGTSSGKKEIQITVETKEWSETRLVRFSYNAAGAEEPAAQSLSKKMDNKQFNWYIPVSYTHLDVYKRQHVQKRKRWIFLRLLKF